MWCPVSPLVCISPSDRAVVHPVSSPIRCVMIWSLPADAGRLPVSSGVARDFYWPIIRLLRGSWVFSLDFSMCASRKISAPAFVSSNRAPPRLPSRGRYVGHRLRLYGWRFTTRDNLPAVGQARTPLIFQRAIVLAIPLHWRQGVDVSLSFRPVKRNLRHVDDGFLTS